MTVAWRVRYDCAMADFFDLDGPRLPPRAGGKADSLVIFLHGLGADGDDLIGLAPYWANALPRTAFVSPHAPFPCDMAPYGRQWFSLQDRTFESILAGLRATAPILDGFIDAEMARAGLTPDRVALVGFSQGTMMSLHVAPRRAQAIAGVVGFSGRLLDDGTFAGEVRSRPPFLLIHGDADPVVDYGSLALAERALKAAGLPVETLSCPGLGHSIDDAGLARGGAFLAARLGAAVMQR